MTASCYTPDQKTYSPGFDTVISNIGFILYALFTFVCITVLINTLIAMLEETIKEIDERADIEWKYARSKLYMEYIRDGKYFDKTALDFCRHSKTVELNK